MKLVVISPEHEDPREAEVLGELLSAGLERYHVRKPHWSREKLGTWLRSLPAAWRSRLVLHEHHELVYTLGVGGRHFRGTGVPPVGLEWHGLPAHVQTALPPRPSLRRTGHAAHGRDAHATLTSRSCHDLDTLRASLGRFDSVFFSPIFPSISKPGHAPQSDLSPDELSALLAHRTAVERRTTVLALGGITAESAPRALALGFDGVAVLGAIWQSADPVHAFSELRDAIRVAAGVRRRANDKPRLVTSAAMVASAATRSNDA